jgi:hypothetical protein
MWGKIWKCDGRGERRTHTHTHTQKRTREQLTTRPARETKITVIPATSSATWHPSTVSYITASLTWPYLTWLPLFFFLFSQKQKKKSIGKLLEFIYLFIFQTVNFNKFFLLVFFKKIKFTKFFAPQIEKFVWGAILKRDPKLKPQG